MSTKLRWAWVDRQRMGIPYINNRMFHEQSIRIDYDIRAFVMNGEKFSHVETAKFYARKQIRRKLCIEDGTETE